MRKPYKGVILVSKKELKKIKKQTDLLTTQEERHLYAKMFRGKI